MNSKKIHLLVMGTLLFVVAYSLLRLDRSVLLNLSDSFFISGIFYLIIALFVYVRNVGFFKLFSYRLYLRRQANEQAAQMRAGNFPANGLSKKAGLAEYCEATYKNQWSSAIYYKFAIPLLATSMMIALYAI